MVLPPNKTGPALASVTPISSTTVVADNDVIESVCTSVTSYSKSKRQNSKSSVSRHETEYVDDERSNAASTSASSRSKMMLKKANSKDSKNRGISPGGKKGGKYPNPLSGGGGAQSTAGGDTRSIISKLNAAVTLEDRIPAIHAACKEFDHFDQVRHKKEIDTGAINSLYQKLCLALTVRNREGRNDEEIAMICAAMEMVYRVSKSTREQHANFFSNEVFPLLLRLLKIFEKESSFEGDLAIESSLKVHFYFSRVNPSAIKMIRVRGFLPSLIQLILSDKNDNIRTSALITLADLACVEENGDLMASFPDLLQSVLMVATNDLDPDVREVAARVIQNLTFSINDDVSQDLQSSLVDALVRLSGDGIKTRKYVAGALQNLSSGDVHRFFLITKSDGAVLKALLSFMGCEEADVRSRAVGALKNLCCQETAAVIGAQVEMLFSLADMCIGDPNKDVRENAADTLSWLAEDIDHPANCHKDLLDALVHIARNSKDFCMSAALMKQSTVAENKAQMARHPGLLDALFDMSLPDATTSKEQKEQALVALRNIAGRL